MRNAPGGASRDGARMLRAAAQECGHKKARPFFLLYSFCMVSSYFPAAFLLAGRLFAYAAFYVVPCLSPLSLASSDALLLRGVYFMCPCLRV